MAEAEDYRSLRSKCMAITTLLPYAVWQERDGQPETFDTIIRAARASRMWDLVWYHVNIFFSTLLSEASPRVVALVSPYINWWFLRDRGDLVQWWAAAASAVPYTEEVAQGVVDTLLQIASEDRLVRYIPADVWSWLTKRPSLPPICRGRYLGTYARVVKVVRGLKDIEILTSYLLLVWSEWHTLDGCDEMCTSIRGDFCGIGMGHHRADLIQRLDHVLGQLDRGLEYLAQHGSELNEDGLRGRNYRYQKLRETLLEIDSRTLHLTVILLRVLTPSPDAHRIPHNIYVCTPSLMSVVSQPERLVLPLPALFVPPLRYHPPDSSHLPTLFSSSPSCLTCCSYLPCRIIMFCILLSYLQTVLARISMCL